MEPGQPAAILPNWEIIPRRPACLAAKFVRNESGQLIVVFLMMLVTIVPIAAEAITAIIIIVTRLHPNLSADLLRPPRAPAPPTAWNPSGLFERRGGGAERRY